MKRLLKFMLVTAIVSATVAFVVYQWQRRAPGPLWEPDAEGEPVADGDTPAAEVTVEDGPAAQEPAAAASDDEPSAIEADYEELMQEVPAFAGEEPEAATLDVSNLPDLPEIEAEFEQMMAEEAFLESIAPPVAEAEEDMPPVAGEITRSTGFGSRAEVAVPAEEPEPEAETEPESEAAPGAATETVADADAEAEEAEPAQAVDSSALGEELPAEDGGDSLTETQPEAVSAWLAPADEAPAETMPDEPLPETQAELVDAIAEAAAEMAGDTAPAADHEGPSSADAVVATGSEPEKRFRWPWQRQATEKAAAESTIEAVERAIEEAEEPPPWSVVEAPAVSPDAEPWMPHEEPVPNADADVVTAAFDEMASTPIEEAEPPAAAEWRAPAEPEAPGAVLSRHAEALAREAEAAAEEAAAAAPTAGPDVDLPRNIEDALAEVAPTPVPASSGRDAESYLDEGNVYFNVGQYGLAIERYTRALELDGTLTAGYYNRANARTRAGEYDGALADYNEALELQPDDADALNNRGMLHLYRANYAAALKDFNAALQADPSDTTVMVNRGLAHLHGGDPAAALVDFQEAAAVDQNDAAAHYGAGQAAAVLGNTDESLRRLRRALQIDPAYAREAAADAKLAILQGNADFMRLLREAGGRR